MLTTEYLSAGANDIRLDSARDELGAHESSDPRTRHALVCAHPGHELCVHGWLTRARPQVFTLTDGSGRAGTPRLHHTTRVLADAGARPGAIYGRFADAELYRALLAGNSGLFIALAEELAEVFAREHFESAAGEACEGYNPLHDLCRFVLDAAISIARREHAHHVANYEFTLIGRQDAGPDAAHPDALRFTLDDGEFARKLAAMRACPELASEVNAGLDGTGLQALRSFGEVSAEVEALLGDLGEAAFRIECLRPASVSGTSAEKWLLKGAPFYEKFAEQLVQFGLYREVIRYREHVLPVAEALRQRSGMND